MDIRRIHRRHDTGEGHQAGSGRLWATAFTFVDGTIFFVAADGSRRAELWMTDGTPARTWWRILSRGAGRRAFADWSASEKPSSSGPSADRTVTAGHSSVATAPYRWHLRAEANRLPQSGTAVNGKLMFRGRDSEHGFELWRSDGTHAGTSLVKEINHRGADTTLDAKVVRNLTRFGGEAFFQTDDGVQGSNCGGQTGARTGPSS